MNEIKRKKLSFVNNVIFKADRLIDWTVYLTFVISDCVLISIAYTKGFLILSIFFSFVLGVFSGAFFCLSVIRTHFMREGIIDEDN